MLGKRPWYTPVSIQASLSLSEMGQWASDKENNNSSYLQLLKNFHLLYHLVHKKLMWQTYTDYVHCLQHHLLPWTALSVCMSKRYPRWAQGVPSMLLPPSSQPLEALLASFPWFWPTSCGHSDDFLFFISNSLSMPNTASSTFKIQNLIITHYLHCHWTTPWSPILFFPIVLRPILYPWPERFF